MSGWRRGRSETKVIADVYSLLNHLEESSHLEFMSSEAALAATDDKAWEAAAQRRGSEVRIYPILQFALEVLADEGLRDEAMLIALATSPDRCTKRERTFRSPRRKQLLVDAVIEAYKRALERWPDLQFQNPPVAAAFEVVVAVNRVLEQGMFMGAVDAGYRLRDAEFKLYACVHGIDRALGEAATRPGINRDNASGERDPGRNDALEALFMKSRLSGEAFIARHGGKSNFPRRGESMSEDAIRGVIKRRGLIAKRKRSLDSRKLEQSDRSVPSRRQRS